MSVQSSNSADSRNQKQSPRLTPRRLENAEPIELKPMSLDEFSAEVDSRTPSASQRGSSSSASTNRATSSIKFGDFGAEIERQVSRAKPASLLKTPTTPSTPRQTTAARATTSSAPRPAPARSATNTAASSRVAPQRTGAAAPQKTPTPTPTAPRRPEVRAANPAEQPEFRLTSYNSVDLSRDAKRANPVAPKPTATTKPSPTPSAPQTRPSGGASAASKPSVPRFDPKTGKPLAGGQKSPFANPTTQGAPKPSGAAKPTPRFDPQTGKPLAANQTQKVDLDGGMTLDEFKKLRAASKGTTSEPSKPKKAPSLGCLWAIIIIAVNVALFQDVGFWIGFIAVIAINIVLKIIYDNNSDGSNGSA